MLYNLRRGNAYQSMGIQYIAILIGGYFLALLVEPLWQRNVYVIHTLFELVSVFISISTFLLVWNIYEKTYNLDRLISFGFLAVAVFDMFHSYYFFGVRALQQGYPDLSTRYWVMGRIAETITLYMVSLKTHTLYVNKWAGLAMVLTFSFGVSALVIQFPGSLPVMSTSEGLTPIKIALEYMVVFVTGVSLYNLRDRLGEKEKISYQHVVMALLIIIPAELLFTLFKVVTSFYSTYGHVLKIIYYYYLYQAVFVNTITSPYNRMEVGHKRLQAMTAQYRNEVQKLNELIALCPVAIFMVDAQGKIKLVNQSFQRVIPTLPEAEIVGQPYRRVAKILGMEYEQTGIVKALRGETVTDDVVVLDGHHWLCHALPVRDVQTGRITGAIGIYHDVTEYEQMRQEMARVDRFSLVAEMAAGVAHEIRNPMTVVRGYLQFLQRKEERYREQFEMMIQELDRANGIITDFLALARHAPAERKWNFLNAIIRSIYPLIYTEAVKQGIEVELQLEDGLAEIAINDTEVKQLVLNLCRNALEAMPDRGKLTIATAKTARGQQIAITDTGCGIPPERLQRIFNPFFTTKDKGTGLGLAVSMNIIERHNAKIEVESQEGEGTTFAVTFH